MPNALSATGLTTATKSELTTTMTTAFQQAYGSDINLSSDSPDGQLMNIFIQVILDIQDLVSQVYNSFDPDNAIGTVLDQRVAINGIQRQAGTYTVTPITVVNSQSVNLYGLDQTAQPVYTVADAAGNQWKLQNSQIGMAAGTHVLNFQAALPGAVTTTPNTITVQVTIVLGVTSVNNPTTYTTLGVNEESDAALKLRRAKSVSLASQGYLQGLLAALENIPGMSAAFVYENNTNTTDSNSVPPHSIWAITSGSALAADIAQAIYTKRNAGCGMKGTQTYNVTQIDGTIFQVLWDEVAAVNIFVTFAASSLNGTTPPNIAAIRAGLPNSFVPGVATEVNINALATQVQLLDANTLVTGAGFTTGQTQILNLSGVPASGTFTLNYNGNATAAINWNDSAATIQTKLQAVTGLAGVLVTGSLASQSLTVNLSALTSVAALIYVATNSLQTSVPAAITFSYNEGYSNTLTPTSKQFQFVVESANIIVTPLVLLPIATTVAHGANVNYSALGGYGAYTYSIAVNNSGGSINSVTGVYTAGSTPLVTDTIKAIDKLGNTITTTVSVT